MSLLAALQPPRRADGNLYLLFRLDGGRYALDVHEIAEVLAPPGLKAMPGAPAWVAGVFEHRGALVPVIDLGIRLCGRPAAALASTRLVLVHYKPAARVLGLLLEQATDTRRIALEAFRDPGLDGSATPYLGQVETTELIQRVEVAELLPDEVRALLFPVAGAGA